MSVGLLTTKSDSTLVNDCASVASSAWYRWIQQQPEMPAPNIGGENLGGDNTGAQSRPAERRRRVLLISYLFPPIGGSAVQRPAKLAKYLPRLGWSVEVLSAGHDRFAWHDASLLTDIPAECLIHRVLGYEPASVARRLCDRFGLRPKSEGAATPTSATCQEPTLRVEDAIYWRLAKLTGLLGLGNGETLWIGPAVRAALRRHRQHPFDAVISTGPPHFVHRVAMRLAQAAGLPWVADVRDPLVHDYYRTSMSQRESMAAFHLEQAILRQASQVVTTCPALAQDFSERYVDRTPGRHSHDHQWL